jgi:hypothetical protein
MTRKTYKKPEVKRVQLKAEESALTACKQRGQWGPGWWRCNPPGPGRCQSIGS